MKIGETVVKAPNDVLDYTFKWKPWLEKDSDTIAITTVSVDSGITLDSRTNNDDSVTAWISGGSSGCTYKITNQIITNNSTPRTKEAHFFIRVELPDVERNKAYGQ